VAPPNRRRGFWPLRLAIVRRQKRVNQRRPRSAPDPVREAIDSQVAAGRAASEADVIIEAARCYAEDHRSLTRSALRSSSCANACRAAAASSGTRFAAVRQRISTSTGRRHAAAGYPLPRISDQGWPGMRSSACSPSPTVASHALDTAARHSVRRHPAPNRCGRRIVDPTR
jgi:hypothetical protein